MLENIELLCRDFAGLLYPEICFSCGKSLVKGEKNICLFCKHKLPETGFHAEANNAVEKLFWGRTEIEAATAFYYFHRGNRVQKLIHQLKYRGKRQLGVYLGHLYGETLLNSIREWKDADLIVPVPLHPSREKLRGYNQCDPLVEGMAEGLQIPCSKHALRRVRRNVSQTGKSKADRWNNVSTIFEVSKPKNLIGKRIILVDDVVTTGSTLEACAAQLLQVPGTRVKIATLAFAPRLR